MNLIEAYLNSLDEGVPLKGHPYHSKTDAELHYILKDASEAARAMKDHSPHSEAKYLDQVNDAATVLHHRTTRGKSVKESGDILERDEKSELAANNHLVSNTGDHHIYVKTKGKLKSIAGPFPSKEHAEKHPARKFGDGVAARSELSD